MLCENSLKRTSGQRQLTPSITNKTQSVNQTLSRKDFL